METTASTTSTAQHPVRIVVSDDLQRNRLTVFFRLILAIPHFLWATLWGVIALLAALVNWFATLIRGEPPEGRHNSLAPFLRYATHVRASALVAPAPSPPSPGARGYPIALEGAPPRPQSR